MSCRYRVQDATGVLIDGEGDVGVLLLWSNSAVGVPASGSVGYQKGCLCIDSVTGVTYVNVGSITSASFVPQLATTFGHQSIPLETFRAISANEIPALAGTPASGILASDTAPKFKRANTSTDKALKIEWAATSVIEIAGTSLVLPPEMDTTKASTINLITKMGGATDTPTITADVFPGLGGTNAGGATGACGSTLAVVSVALAANVFSATFPTFWSLSLTPGAHGTDVLQLYGAYLRYTKKQLSA